jgi:DNA-binding response OmpR family regulator
MNIVILEDNADLREELLFHLMNAGHKCIGCADARALDAHLAQHSCDILVLDLGLPGEDGMSVAARLRGRNGLGIVMLTARGMLSDRLRGLDGGGDAYLVKPVDMRELVAVIESVYRRIRADQPNQPNQTTWKLTDSPHELVAPDATRIPLTFMEYVLLHRLALAKGDVVNRRELIAALGHDYMDYDERRLEAAMSRLRRKLETTTVMISPIRAARSVGYQLIVPVALRS